MKDVDGNNDDREYCDPDIDVQVRPTVLDNQAFSSEIVGENYSVFEEVIPPRSESKPGSVYA